LEGSRAIFARDALEFRDQHRGLDRLREIAVETRVEDAALFAAGRIGGERDHGTPHSRSIQAPMRCGEARHVAVFFSDIVDFTALSERLSPYDVMYLLNRYFAQVGDIIEQNGGFIDKLIGDGLMAIFGIDDQPDAPLRAVNAALQTLATVDRLKPFFSSMYGIDFDIRIGLNYGEAVIGTLGFAGHERLTAIGDVVHVTVVALLEGTDLPGQHPGYQRPGDAYLCVFTRVVAKVEINVHAQLVRRPLGGYVHRTGDGVAAVE